MACRIHSQQSFHESRGQSAIPSIEGVTAAPIETPDRGNVVFGFSDFAPQDLNRFLIV